MLGGLAGTEMALLDVRIRPPKRRGLAPVLRATLPFGALTALPHPGSASSQMGVKFTPGAGVGAAAKYFQETSKVIPTREI